jgi:hypothetical protein
VDNSYPLAELLSIKDCLTITLQRLGDLGVFLVQTLSALLGKRVLVSVRSVVSCNNVDGGVKGAEGGLSSDLGETAVVRHEINHLLFHVLSVVFHIFSSLSQTCSQVHVGSNLLGILIVLVSKTPVSGVFISCDLVRNLNSSSGHCGCEDDCCCSSDGSLQEITTSRLCSFLLLKQRVSLHS